MNVGGKMREIGIVLVISALNFLHGELLRLNTPRKNLEKMRKSIAKLLMALLICSFAAVGYAQDGYNHSKFKQLKEELATPNVYRTASGAPGHEYWQQKADYDIQVEVDDETQRITGYETITYHNNSPDELTYLWLQLDQNMRAKDSDRWKIQEGKISDQMAFNDLKWLHMDFDGGFKIESVADKGGAKLPFHIQKTMMRVDLPKPLKPGAEYSFSVKWWYNVNDRDKIGGRSGYEYFPEEDNYLYTIAQFYPRMAVYNDVEGWQHKQFLGRGEFTLTFGDFDVAITVPEDHVVGATGVLQNEKDVLSAKERSRMEDARKSYDKPVFIVTPEEAAKAESTKKKGKKTWKFHADNVRDFAFSTSRKFMWDAQGVKFGDRTVLAMSYYPKEGNPLWEQYSTKVVAHTIKWYSHYTIDYPYPVAISVHTKNIGMEYPMICFNGGRPEADGTYSARTKHGMISVIIHEVGHNFFPMIINSDERQWTWMDEGLNTYVQYLTEKQWDRDYPSRRGPAWKIADYMKGDRDNIMPIMTNSESIYQFGNNAYGKPATALNILRETVVGRDEFDYAFKEYARRWAFKHPTPADLFRTLEDASGVDLDWFFRGWFYTNEACDISLTDVKWFKIDTRNPEVENKITADYRKNHQTKSHIGITRNLEEIPNPVIDQDAETRDFYNSFDPLAVTAFDKQDYDYYLGSLNPEQKELLESGKNYYEVSFENIGGLVMPIILEFEFVDGTKEVQRIPAEIWRQHNEALSKVFVTDKEVAQITLDPFLETADIDLNNNFWPAKPQPTRFQMYKRSNRSPENPMQRDQRLKELDADK